MESPIIMTPTLEGLPVELQVQILLQVSDLDTLRSLVCSSPAYHQAYQLIRREALQNILQAQYDGLVEIPEALVGIRSKGLYAGTKSNHPKIYALLDSRRRAKEIRNLGLASLNTSPDEPTSITEIIDLLRLHRIAVFLLDDYCENASCPEWMDATKWKTEILPLTFSRTEKKRYFRAFYRLHAHSNIFGIGDRPVDRHFGFRLSWWSEMSHNEGWNMFFGPMAPWEVSEFGCLWQHFHDRHADLYYKIANDVMQSGDGPIDSHEPPLYALPSHIVEDYKHLLQRDEDIRRTLASAGPKFLFRLLRAEDYTAQRNLVLAHGQCSFEAFPRVYAEGYDDVVPYLYPADRFNVGQDLHALQELLETLPDTERPNLAWDKCWLITAPDDWYQDGDNVYEVFLRSADRDKGWQWGYALWDDDRLIEWEAPLEPIKPWFMEPWQPSTDPIVIRSPLPAIPFFGR